MDSRGGRHGSLDAKRGKTNGSAGRRMVFQGARQASRETNCLRIGDRALKEKKKRERERKEKKKVIRLRNDTGSLHLSFAGLVRRVKWSGSDLST